MKSQKKFLRPLLILLLVAILFGLVYRHFGILPGKTKNWAIEKINVLTKKRISFSKAIYYPFRGFVFYDVRVHSVEGKHLFSAKRFSINPRFLSFFTEKKIIIDSVTLDSPVYDLLLDPTHPPDNKNTPPIKTQISGQINVPVASNARKMDPESFLTDSDSFFPENVYLRQIRIINGRMNVKKTADAFPLEVVKSIQLQMTFQRPPILEISGSFRLGDDEYGSVDCTGIWDLEKASYRFQILSKLSDVPSWLLNYQQGRFFIWQTGSLSLRADLRSIDDDRVLFQTGVDLRDADISIHESLCKGRIKINAKGVFDFKNFFVERYRGRLELENATLFNLSTKIHEINHVDAKIDFEPDLLNIHELRGKHKEIPFVARGSLHSFRELHLDGQIETQISLERILDFIPVEQRVLLNNYQILGDCNTVTTLSGSLKKPLTLKTGHKVWLKNGSVRSHDKKIYASNISCEISSDNTQIRVSKAGFRLNDKSYFFSLSFPKNQAHDAFFHLTSGELDFKTDYRMQNNQFHLKKASISMPGLKTQFDGTLTPASMQADVRGDFKMDLAPLSKPYIKKQLWLKTLKPSGLLEGQFNLKGPWNKPLLQQISLSGSGSPLFFQDTIRLDHVEIQVLANEGVFTVPLLRVNLCGGSLGGKIALDLSGNKGFLNLKLYGNGIDAHRVALFLKNKNAKISGNLVFQLDVQGFLKKIESFVGSGSFSIGHGFLFETREFEKMGQLPLLHVQGLDRVTFTDMSAHFSIRAKQFLTQDLLLLSDVVNLTLAGSMSFSGDLDMTMIIAYSSGIFQGALDAGGLVPMMINQAQAMISEYRVRGTLLSPQYEKSGFKTVRNASKKIGGLLQSLTK